MTIDGKLHFVSAGAGSGKTYRLTEILREQLASGQVKPAGVIATTFTRKAAAELRERVREHFLIAGEHQLATAMGQARIGTVNSVCGGLLERFAFEAGRATEQQVLEEGQARDLVRRAIDAATDGPEVAELIRIADRLGIEDWQSELQNLVNQARANDTDVADLIRFANENADDLLGHFPKPWKTDLSNELVKAIDVAMPALAKQAQEGGKKNTAQYVELIQTVGKRVERGEAAWSEWVKLSKTFPEASLKSIAEPVNTIAGRVAVHKGLHSDVREYLERIFALCGGALNIYEEQKRELGVLDFTDQEQLLLKVLENEDVASVLKAEIDLLLVDEFQDTSPIQLALFLRLASFAKRVFWVDIAILSRSNDGVIGIAQHLRAGNIPVATAQPGLLNTPEATLALACLRRLNDGSDTIATAEIISLADSQDPESWVTDRLRYLDAKGDPDLWLEEKTAETNPHPILEGIAQMRRELPLLAPREALHELIADCDIPARVLRWQRDPSVARARLANLEALLELAAQYEDLCRNAQHAASISGFIIWLGEVREADLDQLAQPSIDAVKVMTHHAAKGLEWPVVLLTDLNANVRDRLWSISARSRNDIDVSAPLRDRFLRYWPWPFGLQKQVGVADDIALTDTAKAFRSEAVEEQKRLLYVSVTRARDLLILARSKRKPTGEWLDTVDAPWLMPADGVDHVKPPEGEKIGADTWLLDPPEELAPVVVEERPLHWFARPDQVSKRLPLVFNPSSAPSRSIQIAETARIGERIPISDGVDMTDLGTAIHACIAVAFTDARAPLTLTEAAAILTAMGVGDKISGEAVVRQIDALKSWIGERWPSAQVITEYPVEGVLGSGQVLRGRTDMLVSTPKGWILLDHKANPSGADRWEEIAREHSGQLAEYAAAIEKASGKPVIENWIFLPVAGGAVSFN